MSEDPDDCQSSIEIHDITFNEEDKELLDKIGSNYDKLIITRCKFNNLTLNPIGINSEISYCIFDNSPKARETSYIDFFTEWKNQSVDDVADWWKL